MRIIVQTSLGDVVGIRREYTSHEKEKVDEMLRYSASGEGNYLSMVTDEGTAYIGKDLLKSAVYFFEEDNANN